MPSTRTFNRSFAGGEMSPEMYGRIDDTKFQTGAARMRNFIATPQGPAENRPGFAFVRAVKDSSKKIRLIPFTFSTDQTMVIEMGAGYFRFHSQGLTLMTDGSFEPSTSIKTPYEVANPYAEKDLFDIHHVQSADVLTLVHPDYAPSELSRLGVVSWTFATISFTPSVGTPTGVSVSGSAGFTLDISGITQANPAVLTTVSNHGFAEGDSIYISDIGGMVEITDGFYIVDTVPTDTTFTIKTYSGGVIVDSTAYTAYTTGGTIQFGDKIFDIENYYVVTAIGENGIDESQASSAASVVNNLYVGGAYNTVSWSSVTGAIRYNVYKQQSGLYGYIGQTQSTSFIDDNIAPDMGITPPVYDTVFAGAGDYPGAVSYFEQRRTFAGTTNEPQTMWMTRSGTESDMSYALPVNDTDRIKFRVAAREANTIRHIVPLTQLILLTSSAEWRVTSVNSDAITPTSISVKPQSYVGASNVQPVIVNNSLVYAAARGGHVRELGYSWQANGFITGDMSLRASHLFDTYNIVQMAYSKAPQPLIWMVSSSGQLLGLTYVPEQQIGAWHWHDTQGIFESCTAVAEGDEDVLYVVAKRNINGSDVRYVERMATREIADPRDCFFVDSGGTYNGTNTSATTMTLSGGTTWAPGETLTLTASSGTFQYPATTDVGDQIVYEDTDGTIYKFTIQATSSTTVATGEVDKVVPAHLRNTAVTTWSFARNTIGGLTWLEGETVSILADGAVHPQRVVTSGAITLDRPASIVQVGLPYQSDLQTLPLSMNIDAFGQGRYKNVNKAWLRVYQSSGIFIGPDANNLVEAKQRTTEPYGSPPALKSAEIQIVLTPSWQDAGSVYVRQQDPLPLSIVGMTLEVVVGG